MYRLPAGGRHRSTSRGPIPRSAAVALAAATLGGTFAYDAWREPADPGSSVALPSPGGTPTSPIDTDEPEREPKPKGRLLIHGTGDVSLDPSYIPTFVSNGFDYAWTGLDGLFEDDDLTVVNLESPVSDLGSIVPKKFNFRGDPDALPPMRRAGVEVANLGNNHAYDYGPEALVDTYRNILEAGMHPIGAGRNARQALKPARFRIEGWKVAVLGFGLVVDPFPQAVSTRTDPGVAAGHDINLMVRTVRKVSRRADITIVTIHWGVELDTAPRPDQIELGHRFVDAGADMIFGHHSHRIQPVNRYEGRPIFWGLGNFVWPNFSVEGSTTGVAEVIVERDGRIRGRILPAFIESAGHPVLTD